MFFPFKNYKRIPFSSGTVIPDIIYTTTSKCKIEVEVTGFPTYNNDFGVPEAVFINQVSGAGRASALSFQFTQSTNSYDSDSRPIYVGASKPVYALSFAVVGVLTGYLHVYELTDTI